MNTNEQAPDSCPFCGAGKKRHLPHIAFRWFECGTMTRADNNRRDQTPACATAERERLTRERDEAKKAAETAMVELGQVASSRRDLLTRIQRLEAAHTNALNQIGNLCMENANLLARVKRLEEERDDWKRVAEELNAFMERARSKTRHSREGLLCLRQFDALKAKEAKP